MSDPALFTVPGGPIRTPQGHDLEPRLADLLQRANQEIQRARDTPPTPENLRAAAKVARRKRAFVTADELEAWARRIEKAEA